MIELDAGHFTFQERERDLAATAEADLAEALELASLAVGYLADAGWRLEEAPPPDDSDPANARRAAVFGLGIIGARTARALILLVRNGWEPEAHALKRRLTETMALMRAILDDTSGEKARRWSAGRLSGGQAVMAKYGAGRAWKLFSSGAHPDARSLRLVMVPPPWVDAPENRAADLMPRRDRGHARGLLLDAAYECNLLLVGLGQAFDIPIAFPPGGMADRLRQAREEYERTTNLSPRPSGPSK